MSNIKRTLQMTSLLFVMALIFCYISWTLGYEGFILYGDIFLPVWFVHFICTGLFCASITFLFGYVLSIYKIRILYFSVPVAIIEGIWSIFLPADIFTGPITIFILLGLLILKKSNRQGYKRLIFAVLVSFSWQFITSIVTTINLTSDISMYQVFRLSVNNILVMLILYAKGGIDNDKLGNRRLEFLIFPGKIHNGKLRNESSQNSTEDIPLNKFEKWLMRSVIAIVQILQWMFIVWICSLDNLFLDAIVITTSFICHGMIISKRKHFKSIILCTLTATVLFYVAAKLTLSFQYSQFFPIIIGLLLVYALYRIDYQLEKRTQEKTKEKIEKVNGLKDRMNQVWDDIDRYS